jgi:ATP-dependent Lhr-like helicase
MFHPAVEGFHEATRAWLSSAFVAPTRAQALAWPLIRDGRSALVLAPTGSGKTLAAFLAAIDRVMFAPVPPREARCRVLYISPLKALAVDVERNLRDPLAGVEASAERLGGAPHRPEVAIRTGDTPARDRARLSRSPADILITTPESLYLMLTSGARETLRSVRCVIVDELHALVGTKRGAHLALSLERLEALTPGPLQRIGLSATVALHDEAARFLGGFAWRDGAGESGEAPRARPVTVVDATGPKAFDLTVEVPVEDMARLGGTARPDLLGGVSHGGAGAGASAGAGGPEAAGLRGTSIWPAMHPLLLSLIRAHRSTLVFVNSRRLAERLAADLNELAGEVLVQAHHGSIAREQRLAIEERLKAGDLPALVATSSLELGIDMGAIDLVVQVEAPPAVGSAIQRIGRAGHRLDAASKGIILPKYRGDLLACAALTAEMLAGAVEPLRYPRNPLDVLAQHIVAMVAMDRWRADDVERLVRQAAPFAELPRSLLEAVLDMLSGRYPSDDFAELRPRISWDRLGGRLAPREGAQRLAIANAGTIPDRGLYGVFLAEAAGGRGRVGELDEEMVFETHEGDTFILGASTWRVEAITHDRVVVSPAPGEPGRMPFWHGERAGRSVELGRAIGALARTLRDMPAAEAIDRLVARHRLTPAAARNLLAYLGDQAEAVGAVPDDRTIVIERYRDDMGDWRVCVMSPHGSRVHGPWAMAIAAAVRDRRGLEVDALWADDGIVLRFPDVDTPPPVETFIPDPDDVEALVIRQLGTGGGARAAGLGSPATALFASRFREAAARALLLPRRQPGRRVPLWHQRKRAADLLDVASRFDAFPIVLETYRECLRDAFDLPGLIGLLRQVARREMRVVAVESRTPSPFAAALMFSYVANFLYEGDAPLAERRAQALAVDPAQLREVLGPVELRGLLDAESIATLERWLQHLAPERAARHAEAVHDLLRDVGGLGDDEIARRCAKPTDAAGWIAALARDGRIVRVTIAGESRWIAVEDASRYRDALGVSLPRGLPASLLEPVADPLEDLVARHARTHGPFDAQDAALRLGLGVALVAGALARLAGRGRVIRGEFRPEGSRLEWCDANVLRTLRQRSLARLRREVEPVEPTTLARFLVEWQGLGERRQGPPALLAAVEQLQGAAVPASVLETDILPARVADYDPRQLDSLMAGGLVVWAGAGALGPRDGRVRLYLAEQAPLLLSGTGASVHDGPAHGKIRAQLATRGALFFSQILAAVGGFPPDLLEALWDLVWEGEVTNDTLAPLRARVAPPERRRRPRPHRGPGAVGSRGTPGLPASLAGRGIPPTAVGRWSLVEHLVVARASPTERLAAQARLLLDRHGVLTREAVQAEGVPGGFAAVYPVLRASEEAGRIRRGYFVAGRGATQFALAGAVERLRAQRDTADVPSARVIAATDPANPYGAALPWPEREGGRKPMRAAGAFAVLVDGALAAWLGPGERALLTFPEGVAPRPWEEVSHLVAEALAGEVRSGRWPHLFIEEVDGVPVSTAALAPALRDAGFVPTPNGYARRP